MLDFVDSKTIFTILHLIGVAIGAGGAFTSDAMFFSSVKDKKISHTEMRFLGLGSKLVWSGLALIVISGILLFLGDIENYLNSSKFLAKMTIVGIIILNGIIFHITHIPRLHRHTGEHFPSSDEFMRKSSLLILSGAVSIISWLSAIILGAFRTIPYSYEVIILTYILVLSIAIIFAFFLKKRIISILLK